MAAADMEGAAKLRGHVEVDETRIGGRQTVHHRRVFGDNKTIVMGMVERNGRLRAGPIPSVSTSVLEAHIHHNIEPGTIISTDEWSGYEHLASRGYTHGTVNHSADEYVKGIHHTNTIEGHWSLFKRAIRGTHVQISAKHLWKYAAEFAYRRNNRFSHQAMFTKLVDAFSLPRLQEN